MAVMRDDDLPRVSELIPDPDAPFGFRAAPAENVPDFRQQEHYRLCTRVADLQPDDMWPALRERNEVRRCTACRERVWYDPKSTIYAPTEIIICSPCYEIVLSAQGS